MICLRQMRGLGNQTLEGRRPWTNCEMTANQASTLFRAAHGSVDLQVIDAWYVNGFLPHAYRSGHRAVIRQAGTPGSPPSLNDHPDWAAHTDEQHRQVLQPPSAVGENISRY